MLFRSNLIRKIYNQSANSNKSFAHKAIELFLGKKLVKYKNSKGKQVYKLANPTDEYVPTIKVAHTVERPMDFKNNIYRWLWYIKASRKRMENESLGITKKLKTA